MKKTARRDCAISSKYDTSCSLLQHGDPSTVRCVQPDATPSKRLIPRLLEFDINDLDALRLRHDSWDRNFESPFLSTFSNREHAINWGRIHCADGILYKIDTRKLKNKMHEGRQTQEYLIVGKIRLAYILKATRINDIPLPFRPEREPWGTPLTYFPEAEDNFASLADAQKAFDMASLIENMERKVQ